MIDYDYEAGNEENYPALDISDPDVGVQIQIREDKKVIWIHVDGQTVLRISRIPDLDVLEQ